MEKRSPADPSKQEKMEQAKVKLSGWGQDIVLLGQADSN